MIEIDYTGLMLSRMPPDRELVTTGRLKEGDLIFDLERGFDVEPVKYDLDDGFLGGLEIQDALYGVAR